MYYCTIGRRSDLARPLVFFIITSTLVPLGVVPEPATLATLAPGIIWIIALLATLLSIENLFAEDWQGWHLGSRC
jgi:heme exporter protein B